MVRRVAGVMEGSGVTEGSDGKEGSRGNGEYRWY